ncbi:MAG: hypothetical protein RMJ98_16440 [Myxococcales bacterium]|nr:hypothetical protein [Polyangiaceae bacterium]MDW8250884.1 hypothetical protein [Myxococcales bacterium]
MNQPQPPRIYSAALPPGHTLADEGEPQVILYFRLYAGFVSFSGLGSALFGVYMMVRDRASNDFLSWVVISVIGTLGFFSHLLGVLSPRRPWMHVVGIVLLGVGLFLSCLSWIVNIPLLLYWLKPEVKRWFETGP